MTEIEKYKRYLEMTYEEFKSQTCRPTSDGGGYDYCTQKDKDNDEARLSYIDYLTKDKGYRL